ncbi:MAG: LacI family DNA-binding transcriptional regulator [Planctomycetota bacterium]
MSSVRQIAKELGVSVATVSRAINQGTGVSEETRRRVLEAAERSGYRPSIGKKPTNVIGLVYPEEPVKSEMGDFEAALLSGMLRGVYENRHDLTFISAARDKHNDETYTQFFHRKGVRAIIMRSLGDMSLIGEIASERFPCLLVADRSDDPRVNYIDSVSKESSRQAVEHLVGLGHKRIGLATHNVLDTDHQDREAGFRQGMTEAGLEVDETLIVRTKANAHGGEIMLTTLLEHPSPPTAIFFTNPMPTIGALQMCLRLGIKVPRDLSIVGVDDSVTRFQTFPRYTAVCQDAVAVGIEAARWITREAQRESGSIEVFREARQTKFEVLESTSFVTSVPIHLDSDGQLVRSV